jgi:hypothetical protein
MIRFLLTARFSIASAHIDRGCAFLIPGLTGEIGITEEKSWQDDAQRKVREALIALIGGSASGMAMR